MKTPGTLLLALFLGLCLASHCEATIYYSDGSAANVQALHNLAQDGDTITLPSGTFSWATGVTMTKMITLQGPGTGTGGGDQTVIIDNYASGSPLLSFQAGPTNASRITGITVKSGSGSLKDGGTIKINGPGTVRIDHCHFVASSTANYKIVALYDATFGVMDHCVLDLTDGNAIYLANGRWGFGEIQGNYEWSLPTNFGNSNYFFIEDNIINGIWGGGCSAFATRVYDGWSAAKVVLRFNTLYQSCIGEEHATGHGADDRGFRVFDYEGL